MIKSQFNKKQTLLAIIWGILKGSLTKILGS